jgi:undecaprenyl-diphosphatase
MSIDINLFNFINNLAGRSPLLDGAGIFLASWLPYVILAGLLFLFFRPGPKQLPHRIMALMALAAAVAARWLVKPVIVLFYPRPRPFVISPAVHKLISLPSWEYLQSFPSGHALFFFAATTAVFFYDRKWGFWLLAASIFMGIARIFTGVHYPSDILAGAVIGALTAWAVQAIYSQYYRKVGS